MASVAVPPLLGHKTNAENMWLTSSRELAPEEMEFCYRIRGTRWVGVSEYIEVQRQATHAFAHLALGIPIEHRALLTRVALEVDSSLIGVSTFPSCGKIVLRLRAQFQGKRSGQGVDVDAFFAVAAREIGRGRISGKYLPPGLYERLRQFKGAPLGDDDSHEAARVCEPRPWRSVKSEILQVDKLNPMLDDHSSDHVTGMAVVCALEAAINRYHADRQIIKIDLEFNRYLESSAQAVLLIDIDRNSVQSIVEQKGHVCVRSFGTLSNPLGG